MAAGGIRFPGQWLIQQIKRDFCAAMPKFNSLFLKGLFGKSDQSLRPSLPRGRCADGMARRKTFNAKNVAAFRSQSLSDVPAGSDEGVRRRAGVTENALEISRY